MDVLLIAIGVIAFATVLILSVRNYMASRSLLSTMNRKMTSVTDELLELQRAVHEFDDWAASYLSSEERSASRRHGPTNSRGFDSYLAFARIPEEVYARHLREWAIRSHNVAVVRFLDEADPRDMVGASRWSGFIESGESLGAARWAALIDALASDAWTLQRKGFSMSVRTPSGTRGVRGSANDQSGQLASI